MKLLLFSLAGFAAGVVASWAYIASLKATLKIYRTYIENRLQQGGQAHSGEVSGPDELLKRGRGFLHEDDVFDVVVGSSQSSFVPSTCVPAEPDEPK